MTDSLAPILLFLALAAAGYFAWRWQDAAKQLTTQASQAGEARAKLALIDTVTAERDRYRDEASALAQKLAAEAARAAERDEAHAQMRAEFEKTFETMANRALAQNEQRFLTLANETFEKHKTAAASGVKEAVTPVQEHFAKLAETIAALDKSRTEDKSQITEQMRQISETMAQTQAVTSKLAISLRGAPKTRGRWGEETLRNVLELSGLSQQIDFTEQFTAQDGEGAKLRPDVIIRLPGGRCIVVDAKVALSGYLDAMEATDDTARESFMKKHVQELRGHVKTLGSKDYWRHVPESADFVALFVPGENFYAAAVERDPALFEDAIAARVIIVTPATMIALAKAVAFGWRQEQSTQNAKEIADLGKTLYERLAVLSERMASVGDSMNASVKRYNELVATFETRFVPQAKRFKELGAADAQAELKATPQIEAAPRVVAQQSEFELTPPELQRRRIGGKL